MHDINTRNRRHLCRPNADLPSFQKSKFYAGIKILTILQPRMTVLQNGKAKFAAALRKYLNTRPFYLLDEFFYVLRKFLTLLCKMLTF